MGQVGGTLGFIMGLYWGYSGDRKGCQGDCASSMCFFPSFLQRLMEIVTVVTSQDALPLYHLGRQSLLTAQV